MKHKNIGTQSSILKVGPLCLTSQFWTLLFKQGWPCKTMLMLRHAHLCWNLSLAIPSLNPSLKEFFVNNLHKEGCGPSLIFVDSQSSILGLYFSNKVIIEFMVKLDHNGRKAMYPHFSLPKHITNAKTYYQGHRKIQAY